MKPIDLKQKKILFIGDSHTVLSFGDRMREHFLQASASQIDFHQLAVSGSHLLHWVNGSLKNLGIRNLKFASGQEVKKSHEVIDTTLIQLIREIRPKEVLIALGTNDLIFLKEKIKADEYLMALSSIQSELTSTIWILPPRLADSLAPQTLQEEYKKLIEAKVGCCLQSDLFSPDQSDGVHFFQSLAGQWADHIWKQYLLVKQNTNVT